ncbi:Tfp pilus assembly protein FimT/FimU, partial [Patescibacteria group bacterium]
KKVKSIESGFTLIELMVVVFITVLMSSLTLVNYRESKIRHSLSNSAQILISDLRLAQNLATSGVDLRGTYCGYGLNISSGSYSYFIYADITNPCSASNHTYNDGDAIIQEVALFSGVRVGAAVPSPVDVFFEPPRPTTYINNDDTKGFSATIILEAERFPDIPVKTISVTTAGLIQSE